MTNDKKKIDDGGCAFPTVLQHPEVGDVYAYLPGMSIRDWFAGMAMQGMLAKSEPMNVEKKAYQLADGMLIERSKI